MSKGCPSGPPGPQGVLEERGELWPAHTEVRRGRDELVTRCGNTEVRQSKDRVIAQLESRVKKLEELLMNAPEIPDGPEHRKERG